MRILLLSNVTLALFCSQGAALAANSNILLSNTLAAQISKAIPTHYDKKEDWGQTKEITVGLRTEGKGFKTKIRRRKKPVKHGVWKHYRLKMVQPDENLRVAVVNLRSREQGGVALTLRIDARLDAWSRAKVYQYGVHLIALEAEGDLHVRLDVNCEIGIQLTAEHGLPGMQVDPHVVDARLDIVDFRLRRVSNAHGPLIRELGDGIERLVQRELTGPKLTAKLNQAIEKKRDLLALDPGDMLEAVHNPEKGASPAR